MFCEKCKRIIEADHCPFCRHSKVREPEQGDLCFLTEQDYISSGILEDILKQNSIPYLKKGVMGAGLAIKVGPMLDRSRFYVAYSQLANAMSVVNGFLTVSEENTGQ